MATEFYERDGVVRYRVEAGGTGGGVTSVIDVEATAAIKTENRQDYMRFMHAKKAAEDAAKAPAPKAQTAEQVKMQRDLDQKMADYRAGQQNASVHPGAAAQQNPFVGQAAAAEGQGLSSLARPSDAQDANVGQSAAPSNPALTPQSSPKTP